MGITPKQIRKKIRNKLKEFDDTECDICGKTNKELKNINQDYEVNKNEHRINRCNICKGEYERALNSENKNKEQGQGLGRKVTIWSDKETYR